jgi:excinuclease UvrABC ATPase subunit
MNSPFGNIEVPVRAKTTLKDASVYVMDEPTTGLHMSDIPRG